MLPEESLKQLRSFIEVVKKQPQLLNTPDLLFFKEFIEGFGGTIPPVSCFKEQPKPSEPEKKAPAPEAEDSSDEKELVESDVELDNTGVIDTPDVVDTEDTYVPTNLEVSEENIEKANEKKIEAIGEYNERNYEKASQLFTEAIQLNPGMSLLYVKRGQCSLQLSKPNACIRDCTKALTINPDNAAAYKFRGRAHRLLGHWLEAVKDLRSACKIDYDEQADEWLKEVTPNARKIEEHDRKYERLHAERDIRERQKRVRKAREEQAKAASANKSKPDFGAAGPGMGMGSNGDFKLPDEFMDIFNDPEVQKCFEDPEVFAAFTDISQNPSNLMKYMGNPKIMALITKLKGKFGGSKGFPDGFSGGFPGAGSFPGFGGSSEPPPSAGANNVSDDIGLD